MYGKHFTDTWAGRIFSQSPTPAGLALPKYDATGIGATGVNALPLWNPPGSGVYVELCSLDINYGSGTADYGAVGLMALPLAAVATGALCTALAQTTPVNGFLGGGNLSKVASNNGAGTCTVTAGTTGAPSATAPGWVRSIADFNLEAQTGTAHQTGIHKYDFDGTILVPPGWMIYFAASKASVALYATSLIWKEIPVSTR